MIGSARALMFSAVHVFVERGELRESRVRWRLTRSDGRPRVYPSPMLKLYSTAVSNESIEPAVSVRWPQSGSDVDEGRLVPAHKKHRRSLSAKTTAPP